LHAGLFFIGKIATYFNAHVDDNQKLPRPIPEFPVQVSAWFGQPLSSPITDGHRHGYNPIASLNGVQTLPMFDQNWMSSVFLLAVMQNMACPPWQVLRQTVSTGFSSIVWTLC
jgi:hypothetical protein